MMKNRTILILTVGLSLSAFAEESLETLEPVQESRAYDFNSMIEETKSSEKEFADKMKSANPPQKLSKDGLMNKGKMKRVVIEGTADTVVSQDKKDFFRDPKRVETKQDNFDRLSNELEDGEK